MQVIFESIFDVLYLFTVIATGFIIISKSNGNKQYLLFGIMAIILGVGDSFHLVPRIYAQLTTGLENYTYALGIGKFITSITMTIFYLLIYYVWRLRYKIKGLKGLTILMYLLAFIRILLCLFPQNGWVSENPSYLWGIYRNIPFAIIGIIIIILYYRYGKINSDYNFRNMWMTILLSFAFYIPVVLLASEYPIVGILMIPKTCAYVWAIMIGFKEINQQ